MCIMWEWDGFPNPRWKTALSKWNDCFHVETQLPCCLEDGWQVTSCCLRRLTGSQQRQNSVSHIFPISRTTSDLNRSVQLRNQWWIHKTNGWMTNDSNFPTFPQHRGHHRSTRSGTGHGPQLRFDCRSLRQRCRSSQAVSLSISIVYLGPAWHPFHLFGLCRFFFIPMCDYECYRWWKATGRAGRVWKIDRTDLGKTHSSAQLIWLLVLSQLCVLILRCWTCGGDISIKTNVQLECADVSHNMWNLLLSIPVCVCFPAAFPACL